MEVVKSVLEQDGLSLLAVRDVPVCSDVLGEISKGNEPVIKQIFVIINEEVKIKNENENSQFLTLNSSFLTLERKLYIARKKIEKNILKSAMPDKRSFYVVSLSTQRIIYKGMLTSTQLREYFPDLTNPYFTSGLALVHSRFRTNTFPSWDLAQPFRLLGHNGEINTIREIGRAHV